MNKKLLFALIPVVLLAGCTTQQPVQVTQQCPPISKVVYLYETPHFIPFNVSCYNRTTGMPIRFSAGELTLTDPQQSMETDTKIYFVPQIHEGYSFIDVPYRSNDYYDCKIDYITIPVNKSVSYESKSIFNSTSTCHIWSWDIGAGLEQSYPSDILNRINTAMESCWS